MSFTAPPHDINNLKLEGSEVFGCNLYPTDLENIPKGRVTKTTIQHRGEKPTMVVQSVNLKKFHLNPLVH